MKWTGRQVVKWASWVEILLLSFLVGCGAQPQSSTSTQAGGHSTGAEGSVGGRTYSSSLHAICHKRPDIRPPADTAVPKFKVIKDCREVASSGVMSRRMTVEAEAISGEGLYRIAKVIRVAGGGGVDTMTIYFVGGSGGHPEKGEAFLYSAVPGTENLGEHHDGIVVLPREHRQRR